MGGGPQGSIGARWSWVVALVACGAVVLACFCTRAAGASEFRFPLRPVWAEVLRGAVTCGIILGGRAGSPTPTTWPAGIAEALRRGERHRRAGKAGCSSPTASPFRC